MPSLHAQLQLSDGEIQIGSTPTIASSPCNIYVSDYNGLQWNLGGKSLFLTVNDTHPTISSANNNIYFYNTQTQQYNTIGIRSMLSFMYNSNGNTSSVNNGLTKIMKLETGQDIDQASQKAIPLNFSNDALLEATPELLKQDAFGHQMVDANSMVALLYASLQSLRQQANAQIQEIENLKSQVSLKKIQVKSTTTTEINDVSEQERYPLLTIKSNPIKDRLVVHYQLSPTFQVAKLRINDINGKKMAEGTINDLKGKWSVESKHWGPGMYFCSLIQGGEVIITQKAIKK